MGMARGPRVLRPVQLHSGPVIPARTGASAPDSLRAARECRIPRLSWVARRLFCLVLSNCVLQVKTSLKMLHRQQTVMASPPWIARIPFPHAALPTRVVLDRRAMTSPSSYAPMAIAFGASSGRDGSSSFTGEAGVRRTDLSC